jgi:tetratricopeptide (TPR) repeat protein
MFNKYQSQFHIFVILVLLFVAYGNSLSGKWYFDDYPNIVHNVKLHIDNVDITSLTSVATANPSKPKDTKDLYRPTALLSFAFNYLISGTDPFSYHLVNIAIHIATSFFLYFTLVILLGNLRTPSSLHQHAESIALIATLLWSLAPIQTQAVTYIVQRMTSLAGLFSIISIYFYSKMRSMYSGTVKIKYIVAIIASFLLGIGSKENAILIPFNLILIEFFFFREFRLTRRNIVYLLLSLLLIYLITTLVTHQINIFSLFANSSARPFSSFERLLTEFRVLNYYFIQILIPNSNNLTLLHDIPISTSIITPPTTILSFSFLAILVFIAILSLKRFKILSFSILFFLINHSIESSFIPLEIAFEHRNYIPSLFFFLPISALLIQGTVSSRNTKFTKSFFILFICSYIAISVFNTIKRNHEWTDPFAFWHKEARLNQHSPRAASELGNLYLQQNNTQLAIDLFEFGLRQNNSMQNKSTTESALLNGLGVGYFQLKDYNKALSKFADCLKSNPNEIMCWKNTAITLTLLGDFEKAHHAIDILLNYEPNSPSYNLIKGVIYLKQELIENALTYLDLSYSFAQQDKESIIHFAHALTRINQFQKALNILDKSPSGVATAAQIILMKSYIYKLNEDQINSRKNLESLRKLYPKMSPIDMAYLSKSTYGIELFDKKIILKLINDTP